MKSPEKSLLRRKMLETRMSLAPNIVKEKSQKIMERLLSLPLYDPINVMLFYLPFKNEVDTLPLLKISWQNSKKTLVPVCEPGQKLLLSELLNLNELIISTYGLYEPKNECLRPVSPQEVDLALLPGVAFDKNGYRLGYGGGYYDRFLKSLRPDCAKIALAYDLQVVDRLPIEEHDTRADIILTESKTYAIGDFSH